MPRAHQRTSLGTIGRVLCLTAAAGASSLAWASLIERRWYALRRVTAPVLPSGSRSLRVLHLSDLHMAPWQRDKQEWIRSLADLRPDLIVNTGDNLGHVSGLDGIQYAFERFRGIPGVFVNGSNDYFGPTPKNPMKYFTGPSRQHVRPADLDVDGLREYFTGLGWLDLNNAAGTMTLGGTELEFFGVDDPHRHFDSFDEMQAILAEVREHDAPATPRVSIGVAHAPYQRVLDAFVGYGARMIFAGHTHGGQVCVPGFGALVTNCDIPRRQVKGLSRWPHGESPAYLNVSAGLGTSIYAPVRFDCRPEASLVTLAPIATS